MASTASWLAQLRGASDPALKCGSCQTRECVSAALQAATDIRKEVNVLDNQTTGKAVDALLNYETVALFNNQVGLGVCLL